MNAPPQLTWSVATVHGHEQHQAWSDQLLVGAVTRMPDGSWFYDATFAVRMQDQQIAAGYGYREALHEAKTALERDWATWLKFAGLVR